MKNFILFLLTVILIEPSLAQIQGYNYHSNTAFHFQDQVNGNFDKLITFLEEAGFSVQKKTAPITNEQTHVLMVAGTGTQPVWSKIQKEHFIELMRDRCILSISGMAEVEE